MSEPLSTTVALKVGLGTLTAGVLYASAVAADSSLPAPTVHGAVEVLMASLLAWVVRELRYNRPASASLSTATQPSWRDAMLKLAEEAAVGTKDIGEKLALHREEFTEFRGETRSRLNNLEKSVKTRIARMESGEA